MLSSIKENKNRGKYLMIDFLSNQTAYIDDVANMIYKEFVEKTSSKMTFLEVKKFFSNTKMDEFPITLIALEDGKCIGTVSIFENDLKTQDLYKPWLASLYTKPEFRGKGVGQILITETLKVVKDLGYKELYLRTENAAEYYKNRGWVFIGNALDAKNEKVDIFKFDLKQEIGER